MGNTVPRREDDTVVSREDLSDTISDDSGIVKGLDEGPDGHAITCQEARFAFSKLREDLELIKTTNKFIVKRLNEQKQWIDQLKIQHSSQEPTVENGEQDTEKESVEKFPRLLEKVISELELREKNRDEELNFMKGTLKAILGKLDNFAGMKSNEPNSVERNLEVECWYDSAETHDDSEEDLVEGELAETSMTGNDCQQSKDDMNLPAKNSEKSYVRDENTAETQNSIKTGDLLSRSVQDSKEIETLTEDGTVHDTVGKPLAKAVSVNANNAQDSQSDIESRGQSKIHRPLLSHTPETAKKLYTGFELTDEQSEFAVKLRRKDTRLFQDNRVALSYDLEPMKGFLVEPNNHAANESKSILKSDHPSRPVELERNIKNTSPKTVRFEESTENKSNITVSSRTESKSKKSTDKVSGSYISDGDWATWAQQESSIAKSAQCSKGKGIYTVLLLDISSSMGSPGMLEMKNAVKDFLHGIEDVALEQSLEENVAIVTFGHETRVVQHLTNNYVLLRKQLETITIGGRSPLYAGIMMATAALADLDSVSVVPYHPRVIIFTDGQVTDSQSVLGDDTRLDKDSVEKVKIVNICENLSKKLKIYCVAVGNFDRTVMNVVTKATRGKIINSDDARQLSKTFQHVIVGDRLLKGFQDLPKHLLESGVIEATQSMEDMDSDELLEVMEEMKRHGKMAGGNLHEERDDGSLLPLGTRVRRGPDWSWDNQDENTAGTVIGHDEESGWLGVEWDSGGSYTYRYGSQGYDVLAVDEPRVIPEDKLIAVGCCVKRGKDWHYEDQDGGAGNIGVVIRSLPLGVIVVRWPSKLKANYQFGMNGQFDVEICDPSDTQATMSGMVGATAKGSLGMIEGPKKRNESTSFSIDEMNRRNALNSASSAPQTTRTDRERSKTTEPQKPEPEPDSILQPNTELVSILQHNTGSSPEIRDVGHIQSTDQAISRVKDIPTSNISEFDETKSSRLITSEAPHGASITLSGVAEQNMLNTSSSTLVEAQLVNNTETIEFPSGPNFQNSRTMSDSTARNSIGGTESSDDTSRASSPGLVDDNVAWMWLDNNGSWQSYSHDQNMDIERAYKKRPKSTKIIRLNGEMWRVIFTSMTQVNTSSHQKLDIKRMVITDDWKSAV
ncbi:hypothetical protein ScPMuIL_018030 [Solemya velum]